MQEGHAPPAPPALPRAAAARGRVLAAGLSALLLLAVALLLPCAHGASGGGSALHDPRPALPRRAALLLGEFRALGWRGALARVSAAVLQGRPMLGRRVRDVPLFPAGRTGECVSALDCTIEAAQQYKLLASQHARRAAHLAGACHRHQRQVRGLRAARRRDARRRSGVLRAARDIELRMRHEGAEWMRNAEGKLEELRALSEGPDFAVMLAHMDEALLREEKLQEETARLALRAEDAEAKAAAAQRLADELHAQHAVDEAARASAAEEAQRLSASMAQLRQTVLRTEEQLAEVQEALNAERVARKSAVDLVDQLQQVKQDDERESAELRALLAAERQNVETGGREAHALREQMDALSAQLQQERSVRAAAEARVEKLLDSERRTEQQYEHQLASERALTVQLQDAVARLQAASAAAVIPPSQPSGAGLCGRGQPLCDMLVEGTSAWEDEVEKRHFLPHQAVASLLIMVLSTGVSLASLVASRMLTRKPSDCVLVAEGAMQTDGPTVEDVEATWRQKVEGVETEKGLVLGRVDDLNGLLAQEQQAVKALEHQLQTGGAEMEEARAQQLLAAAQRDKALLELASLHRHVEALEAKVSTAHAAQEQERKGAATLQHQMAKQRQHMEQDAEKALRQLQELRSTLQHKTSAMARLEQQVEQQKLILLAAQQQQQHAAEALDRSALADVQEPGALKPSVTHNTADEPTSGPEAGRQDGAVKQVKTMISQIEGGEWQWARDTRKCGGMPTTATPGKQEPHTAGVHLFSPDMAPSMRQEAHASREDGCAEASPGGMPQEGDDFGGSEMRAMAAAQDAEMQWAAVRSSTMSVTSSVTDEARSEISGCDSEASYYSAPGSVRSLASDFSEASAVSSTALSQAATLASGGSRADREAARRQRAKRKEKSSRDPAPLGADKENVHNGVRARVSQSQRGLGGKGLARWDLSAAPSFAASSLSVGFVAAGELPQGLLPSFNSSVACFPFGTHACRLPLPRLRICAHTAHVQMRSAQGIDESNACVCFRVLAGRCLLRRLACLRARSSSDAS